MELIFREDIEKFIAKFGGKFDLIDFGFPNNDYLSNGFWLHLKANFNIRTKSFDVGSIHFEITGREVYVNKGFLNDIEFGLNMIS